MFLLLYIACDINTIQSLRSSTAVNYVLPMPHKELFKQSIIKFKLPFVINIFVLSIFEWPLKTGFTVLHQPFVSTAPTKDMGGSRGGWGQSLSALPWKSTNGYRFP